MAEILELLKAANGLSPLAIIGLLVVVVLLLVKGRKDVSAQVKDIGDNHLQDVTKALGRIEGLLQSMFANTLAQGTYQQYLSEAYARGMTRKERRALRRAA